MPTMLLPDALQYAIQAFTRCFSHTWKQYGMPDGLCRYVVCDIGLLIWNARRIELVWKPAGRLSLINTTPKTLGSIWKQTSIQEPKTPLLSRGTKLAQNARCLPYHEVAIFSGTNLGNGFMLLCFKELQKSQLSA